MKAKEIRDYQAYLFIALFTVVAYWPMSTMLFSAKNDAIHYFLAMRYNSSEMLQHGMFPSWSPYINLGYPLHGDIQSGVWNPVVFLMSLVRQYDIYWLHTEIMLINMIAGIGMYRLLRYFNLDTRACLAMAAAYLLNGYMTDAGQFLNWLYAGAFLPFVVKYAHRALHTFSPRDGFALGLSFSLMLLCGYPADSILAAYLLFAWFVFSLVLQWRKSGAGPSLGKHLKVGGTALLSVLILCLPALISFAEFFPEVRRGAGVSLELAQSNSLAPANLVSLLYPWVTLKGGLFSGTDPLIRNCFIGLISLSFFIVFLLQKRKAEPWQKFLLWSAAFFLVFSLGKHTPLRSLAYDFLPLMDSFRHPANAKLFFMFIAQLLAGFAMHRYLQNGSERERGLLRTICIGLLLLSSLLFVISLFGSQVPFIISQLFGTDGPGFATTMKNARDALSTADLLVLNSLFAGIFLAAVLVFLKKGSFARYLVAIVFFEMMIAAQLMLPLTYVRNYSPATVDRMIDAQPKGYPVPDLGQSLAANSSDGFSTFEDIGCLNVYNKKIGRVDYIITPSNLSVQEEFWENEKLRNEVMNLPPALVTGSGVRLAFLAFSPKQSRFRVSSRDSTQLIYHQNFYHRWNAFLDGKSARILPANGAFLSVYVPPGEHTVEFRYEDKDLKLLAIGSLVFAISGILYYFFNRKKSNLTEPRTHQ